MVALLLAPNGVIVAPRPDLSAHWVTFPPPLVVSVLASAASIQRQHPGIVLGSNPKYCWVPKFTLDAIVYSSKNELFAAGETTNVTAFEGGMMTGLAIVTVFAIVTLR
jgi:hypothetical protein